MISNGDVPSSNDVDGVPRVPGDVDVMGSTVDERSLVAAFVNGETPLFDCEVRNPLADREEDEINAARIILFILMLRKKRSRPDVSLRRTNPRTATGVLRYSRKVVDGRIDGTSNSGVGRMLERGGSLSYHHSHRSSGRRSRRHLAACPRRRADEGSREKYGM